MNVRRRMVEAEPLENGATGRFEGNRLIFLFAVLFLIAGDGFFGVSVDIVFICSIVLDLLL
jgi:hypothetical protein